MGIVIGMDEAGYGPNLGPLVVTATVWDVPGRPRDTDFWSVFSPIARQSAPRDPGLLHVADSKIVYSPARGIGPLEKAVLSARRLVGDDAGSFHDLVRAVTGRPDAASGGEPWFDGAELSLPQENDAGVVATLGERWRQCCERVGVRLRAIRCDVVFTQRFNSLVRQYDSKGVALSRISLALLREVWDPNDGRETLIVADKHGGRNRYDALLAEVLDGRMIFRLDERREVSRYRVGETELRFQMKAESNFPVALASMVSKYLRELAMTLFNRYWAEHVPGLKPTKGYPTDAYRFKTDIAAAQTRLGISDDVLWRER